MALTAAALSASMTVAVSPASDVRAEGIVDCARSTAAASASSECETLLAEAFSRAHGDLDAEVAEPRATANARPDGLVRVSGCSIVLE